MKPSGRLGAIVAAVPPPGKLGGARPAPADGEEDGEHEDGYEGDEDKAAEVAAIHRFAEAFGLKVEDEKEACSAFRDLMSVFDKDEDEGEEGEEEGT